MKRVGVLKPRRRCAPISREVSIRDLVRRDLPRDAFAPRPFRTLWFFPIAGSIGFLSIALVRGGFPGWMAALMSLLIGHQYACLFFFGHELSHGAMTRSRRLQEVLLSFCYLIFALPPHFVRTWHLAGHHAHTNVLDADMDTYGHLEDYQRSRRTRFLYKFAPGSGHWLSAFYLFTFALQGQVLLWFKVRGDQFPGYRRGMALMYSAAMILFWVTSVLILDWPRAALVVVIPAMVASAIVLIYGATNHNLRPLSENGDTLSGSMSVTTPRVFDRLHFHFSHHTEHHLFPRLPSLYAPLVRQSLQRHAPLRYLAPPVWKALLAVFLTPRVYQSANVLIDPRTGRTVTISNVEAALRTRDTAGVFALRR